MLAIVFIMTNMVAQNYCAAQDKLKPENCAYFQVVSDNEIGGECIWIGSDRKTKLNKWILIGENEIYDFIETSRDEWSIYLKRSTGYAKGSFTMDFNKKEASFDGDMIGKIQNQKQEYDYSKLGGAYLKK